MIEKRKEKIDYMNIKKEDIDKQFKKTMSALAKAFTEMVNRHEQKQRKEQQNGT